MKPVTLLTITTAVTSLWMTQSTAQDLTRTYKAIGPEVVEAVVDEVRGSCILSQDNLLLRRLAYVESRDGTDGYTFRPGFMGGIWQVSQAMYDETKTSSYLQRMRADIGVHLNIDWMSTSWQDLLKPLYSGLAAALYIEDSLRTNSRPVGISEQEDYWERLYHPGGFNSTNDTFSSLASLMQLGCTVQSDLDIAFVLDTSSSISPRDFIDAKEFIIATADIFPVDQGLARVALITYADVAALRVGWGAATTRAQLAAVVRQLTYESGGTETARALDLANTLFRASRPKAVKVLVLVTDGQSHDTIDTAAAAARLTRDVPAIVVLAVGVGDQVDVAELRQVASAPRCRHTFQVDTYRQVDALRQEIQRTTCRAPLALNVNQTVRCTLGQCPPYVLQVPPNSTLLLTGNTTCTDGVRLFASSSVPYPSASRSDTSITLTSHAPSSLHVPTSGSSSAHFYVNTDQTSLGFQTPGCGITLTLLENSVLVRCVDGGTVRPCSPVDIANFQLTSGEHLCP